MRIIKVGEVTVLNTSHNYNLISFVKNLDELGFINHRGII